MTPSDLNLDYSTRDIMQEGPFRESVNELRKDVALGDLWRTFMAGRSVTSEEAQLMIVDLLMTSQYFEIAPPGTTGEALQRREGARELMGRILFLADLPSSYITRLRRDALDELQKLNER